MVAGYLGSLGGSLSSSRTFVAGQIYYAVFYHDERCLVPEIDTLVYLGQDLPGRNPGAPAEHFFQSAYSYYRHGDWTKLSEAERDNLNDHPLHAFDAKSVEPLCDLDGLLQELGELQGRQRGNTAP